MGARHSRTEILFSADALEKIKGARVAVIGIGGVGSGALECLARSGVGTLVLVDSDVVEESNLNRQLIAVSGNIGMPKVMAGAQRVRDIDPSIVCIPIHARYEGGFPEYLQDVDCVVDAIDDLHAKAELISQCRKNGVEIYSSMGTALRLSPECIRVGDVFSTSYDPMAKVMRKLLRDKGVERLTVVYSVEQPKKKVGDTLGSYSPVPVTAGCTLASLVLKRLTMNENT